MSSNIENARVSDIVSNEQLNEQLDDEHMSDSMNEQLNEQLDDEHMSDNMNEQLDGRQHEQQRQRNHQRTQQLGTTH